MPETADVELVSLEDADAEASGKKVEAEPRKATTISRSRRPKRPPSSKRQEEGDDDVTDIIGEGREDEEET